MVYQFRTIPRTQFQTGFGLFRPLSTSYIEYAMKLMASKPEELVNHQDWAAFSTTQLTHLQLHTSLLYLLLPYSSDPVF